MTLKTYRSTLKTLFRSPLMWAAAVLMLGAAAFYVIRGGYGTVDTATLETIWDTNPKFVLEYSTYIQHFHNTMAREVMLFGIPLFCVVVSGVVLRRDWSDSFFEIERAGGVRPLTYFLGRYAAVFTVLTAAALITYVLSFHIYVISRGGVPDLSPWEYVLDSNVRLLRLFFITAPPAILVFSGITFLFGSLTKSGIAGMIGGTVYVIFIYLTKYMLRFRLPQFFHNYLTPTPRYLYQYWAYYDTEWFTEKIYHNPFTDGEMILCICVLCSIAAVCLGLSFVCVRRRKV